MAQRIFTYSQTLEREVKILYGSIAIGGTGAVGTVKGGFTVTRNSTGNYTVVFGDKYNRLLWLQAFFVGPATSGVASVEQTATLATYQATFKTTGAIVLQCYDYAGAAVDPASGSLLTFVAHVRNTDVSVGND